MRRTVKAVLAAGVGALLLMTGAAHADGLQQANAGMAAMERGDYRAAAELFTKALVAGDLGPADMELALVKRAESYLHVGLAKAALPDLDQALRLDPNDAEAADLLAQAKQALAAPAGDGPKSLGRFSDWTAATHTENGRQVCYIFTRAVRSSPSLAGRGEVVLTVTERPTGRDQVAISHGLAFPAGASVSLTTDRGAVGFYTAASNAFARDGHAAVGVFSSGREAVSQSPGPNGVAVTDTFSLNGFSAAYAAMARACP
jgi:tetratricopeptide (TPR) repeat protein